MNLSYNSVPVYGQLEPDSVGLSVVIHSAESIYVPISDVTSNVRKSHFVFTACKAVTSLG